ncbi:hypothetical protein [Endozoicomonas sp. ALB091]|uniref:hypothetical protein n=1 Tax=Endozoicomonas sp. ALB091 TaxID=3403073 RepID=UPI003BB63D4E
MRYLFKATLLALAVSSAVHAVEFKPEAASPEVTAVSVQPQIVETPATAVTTQLQTMPAQSAAAVDAMDLAYQFLDKGGVLEGWNSDKRVYVALSEAIFDSEDPSYDDSFIIKRSLKSMEASLDAKRSIIQYIYTDMSAADRVSTPGTDLNVEFKDKLENLERKAAAQRGRVAKLLEVMDAKEAQMLRGVTFGDRADALMEAAIKKLDGHFDKGEIAADKQAQYEQAKANYQEAMSEHESTMNELDQLAGSVTGEAYSMAEAVSKMPLYGAITAAQFESWDDIKQQYKVAMVTVWSPKQEEMIRALLSGEAMTLPKGKQNLADYIRSQDWSTATGGRKFRDSSGNFHILGIAASPVGSSSSSERKARGIAELMARKQVATALYADVAAYEKAEQAMTTLSSSGGKDVSIAAESFTSELSQSIENRAVQGLSKRFGRRVTHPLSGQDIYVSIYSIDTSSVVNARLMQASQYQTKVLDIQSQQQLKGTKDGLDQSVRIAESSKAVYNQAEREAASSNRVVPPVATQQPVKQQVPVQNTQGTATSGAYTGGGNADAEDAFGW